MFAHKMVISIAFRFINFFVLVALFTYLFKKYFYGKYKAKIAAAKALMENLHIQKKQLNKQQKDLDKKVVEQAKYELLRKFNGGLRPENQLTNKDLLRLSEGELTKEEAGCGLRTTEISSFIPVSSAPSK